MDVHIVSDFFDFVNVYSLLAGPSRATASTNTAFVLLLEFIIDTFYGLVVMKKSGHGKLESRHSRSKQFDQEENDHPCSLGIRGILVTSGMHEKNRRYER